MINSNPQTDAIDAIVEITRVETGGTVAGVLGPAAAKILQAGNISTGGDWQPYGRVDITPVSDFRAA